MDKFRKHLAKMFGLVVTLCSFAPLTLAAETNPFFASNAAKTVFGGQDAVVTVGGKIPESFQNGAVTAMAANKSAEVLAQSETINNGANNAAASSSTIAQPLSNDARAKVLEQFGDPTKEVPLRTVDNAPTPFKGMMAALDAGDEGLAQQYAQQFQRYNEKLQRSNLTAVNMLTDVVRTNETQAKEQLGTAASRQILTPEELAKLKQSATQDGQVGSAPVPVDPEGKVQVFFFFNSSDTKSGAAAREVERLSAALRNDKRVQIVGVSADMMGNQAALDFKHRYEISFSVIADTPLAASLGIKTLPSIALVSPATQKVVLKEGPQKFSELRKLVRSMQGIGVVTPPATATPRGNSVGSVGHE